MRKNIGKHVYVLLFSNDTIKIGISNSVRRRGDTIIGHSGLEIILWCFSERLDDSEARRVEACCHKHFANRRIRREFFDVSFDEACVYLQSQVKKPLIICKGEKI